MDHLFEERDVECGQENGDFLILFDALDSSAHGWKEPYRAIRGLLRIAVAFFDGRNPHRRTKAAFGHHHPDHGLKNLFDAVRADKGWASRGVRFHIGMPAR